MFAHHCRCDLNVLHKALSHLLNHPLVSEVLCELFTLLRIGHAEVLLHFLFGAEHCDIFLELLIHLAYDFAVGHLHTVDCSLMQKQFLHSQLLRNDTIWIAFNPHPVRDGLEPCLFHVRLEYRLIANHPDYLVDDISLSFCFRNKHHTEQGDNRKQIEFHILLFVGYL